MDARARHEVLWRDYQRASIFQIIKVDLGHASMDERQ